MKENIQHYYGTLASRSNLRDLAGYYDDNLQDYIRKIKSNIHPKILLKHYGCGSPIPLELRDKTVLELGCGSGVHSFVLSKLVGSEGKVIGIGMTREQIELADNYIYYHQKAFRYEKPNMSFILGDSENFDDLCNIPAGSVDVVVSNCILNFAADKERVFNNILRLLVPGGECQLSGIFVDRRLPEKVINNPLLYAECIGGAMYFEDFRRILHSCGVANFRTMFSETRKIVNPHLQTILGDANLTYSTVRFFKLDLDDKCENYGHVAKYKGGIEFSKDIFILDDNYCFEKGVLVPVCRNTAKMLSKTRFAKYFEVFSNNGEQHCGLEHRVLLRDLTHRAK